MAKNKENFVEILIVQRIDDCFVNAAEENCTHYNRGNLRNGEGKPHKVYIAREGQKVRRRKKHYKLTDDRGHHA